MHADLSGRVRRVHAVRVLGEHIVDLPAANGSAIGHTDIRLPWGGARDSGYGREHGEAAIQNFTEPKAVWTSLAG